MPFFSAIREGQLGLFAVFACIGLGFVFLRKVDPGEVGPGYWATSFFLNSLGFLFWSEKIPIAPLQYYLFGEILHISGFIALICGVYRFTGRTFRPWNAFALVLWLAAWLAALFGLRVNPNAAGVIIKALRAILFASAGFLILRRDNPGSRVGKGLAGLSLFAWGAYVLVFAFVRLKGMENVIYGFLAGFQVLAAFGLVVLVVDRMRTKAEESDRRADRLEGLLPICAYCKKIRDSRGAWQPLELYIEDRSSAEFSHGICPDCMRKHKPDES